MSLFTARSGETWRSPWAASAELREGDPVHDAGDFWVLSRFADVYDAARDTTTYSSARGLTMTDGEAELGLVAEFAPMVMLDPPDHTVFRRMVSRGFTPRQVTELEPRIRSFVRERLAGVDAAVAGRPRPDALVLEWTDPPFAPGHWVPEMVARAGGSSVLGTAGEKSFRTTWDAVAASRPEIVVVAPCGYHLAGATELAGDLVASDVLPSGIPVWAVDANASFARPGPRLVDGVEALAAIFHPEVVGAPDPGMARRIA